METKKDCVCRRGGIVWVLGGCVKGISNNECYRLKIVKKKQQIEEQQSKTILHYVIIAWISCIMRRLRFVWVGTIPGCWMFEMPHLDFVAPHKLNCIFCACWVWFEQRYSRTKWPECVDRAIKYLPPIFVWIRNGRFCFVLLNKKIMWVLFLLCVPKKDKHLILCLLVYSWRGRMFWGIHPVARMSSRGRSNLLRFLYRITKIFKTKNSERKI